MLTVALSCILLGAVIVYLRLRAKYRPMMMLSERIPGPKLLPVVGNALYFGLKTEGFFENINRAVREYGNIARVWLGNELLIILSDPKYAEIILTSTQVLDKAFVYKFMHPWLGEGLLTNTGPKWKEHRKLFTPAFHFKILEEFVEVFGSKGSILREKLEKHVNGPGFDIRPYISLYTLDIICETAMGVQVNAQKNSDSEYVRAVQGVADIVMRRTFSPWFHLDFLFRPTPLAKEQAKYLSTLHDMTDSVIKTRKDGYLRQKTNTQTIAERNDIGAKKRLAFLDLLIEAQQDGASISDKEIREEVDTFMFEGHDTTTSGISFTLWALAKHPDVQAKAVQEQRAIFGESDHYATYKDLQEMKYLEQVIKETQRLYPSVPTYGRKISENLTVGEYDLPAGSNIVIHAFMIHRHPEYFPDPERFDPDRFLTQNCKDRHPYCYVPFSAGPRNCIGQRFAMLEMKATISAMLRHYKLSLEDPNDTLRLTLELVMKSSIGTRLKLEPRA